MSNAAKITSANWTNVARLHTCSVGRPRIGTWGNGTLRQARLRQRKSSLTNTKTDTPAKDGVLQAPSCAGKAV